MSSMFPFFSVLFKTVSGFGSLFGLFYRRMFVGDSENVDTYGTRPLQLALCLMLPGVIYTLALAPSYTGLIPLGQLRPPSSQLEDHFVFVTYSFCVAGIAVLLKWPSILPSELDVRILEALPIARVTIFGAKAAASACFFSLFIVCASMPSTLLLPGIAGESHFFRHVYAHAVSTTLAAIFAGCLVVCLLSISLILARLLSVPAISALFQSLLMSAFLLLLFLEVPFAAISQVLLRPQHSWALDIPSLWFVALYERLMRNSSSGHISSDIPGSCLFITLVSATSASLLFVAAYSLERRYLLRDKKAEQYEPSKFRKLYASQGLGRSCISRSTYYLTQATVMRLGRSRNIVLLFGSLGLVLAMQRTIDSLLPFRSDLMVGGSTHVALPIVIVLFALAQGLFTVCSLPIPILPESLFELHAAGSEEDLMEGTVRWVRVLMMSLGMFASVALLAITSRGHSLSPFWLGAPLDACLWALIITNVIFIPFSGIPFTAKDGRVRALSVYLVVSFVVGLPLLMFLTRALDYFAVPRWLPTLLLVGTALGTTVSFRTLNRRMRPLVDFLHEDGGTQRLDL